MTVASVGPLGEMCGACHYAVLATTFGEAECHGNPKQLKPGGNPAVAADYHYNLVLVDQDWCRNFRPFGQGDPGHYP